jgi:hypothetical protein
MDQLFKSNLTFYRLMSGWFTIDNANVEEKFK